MDEVWAEIEQAAEAGDPERVADLALTLDEPARGRLRERAMALYNRVDSSAWYEPVPRAAQTVRFAIGPPLKPGGEWSLEPPPDRLEALIRSRPRPWRDAWAWWVVRHGHYTDRPRAWVVLRTLIRDGACVKPAGDDYIDLLMRMVREGGPDVLRADPEVAWEPFALERPDHRGLGWPEWSAAMIELAADGTLSRERLIDETFGAIEQTDHGATSKHWRDYVDALALTSAEFEARLPTYLRWLESDRDPLIGFALVHLLRWDKAHPLDAAALLDRLGVAVTTPAKAHAKRALTLVGRALDREPALAPDATQLLADALGHSAAEVQEQALGIAQRHPDALPQIDERALDPALRRRMSSTRTAVEVPPPPEGVPRRLEAITPVADLEELLELASQLVESPDDPDESERLADGISRLCDQPVPPGRRSALLKRTRKWDMRVDAPLTSRLIREWLAPSDDVHYGWTGPSQAIGQRLTALTQRVHRSEPDILLSAPTHRGGFLDPAVLAERLQHARQIEDHDLAQAILRTGTPIELPDGEYPAARESLCLLEEPVTPDEADADRLNVMGFAPGSARSPARALAEFEGTWSFTAGDVPSTQRWLALVWPGHRELHYACVHRTLWCWREHWHYMGWEGRLEAALRTMLYRDEPLGQDALALIALGLLLQGGNRLLATDVVIDAIAARRLDPLALAERLPGAVRWPETNISRLAGSLQPLADSGPLHRHELQRLLEALLPRLGVPNPQLIGLVDLLRRLALEDDAAVTGARDWLASTTPTSKSGKLARAALAVTGDGAERSIAAAEQARAADAERAA